MAVSPAIPKMSDVDLYTKSLNELVELRNDFARTKWKTRLAAADAPTKLAFSRLRAKIQELIRTLTNARLAEIAGELRKNETGLKEGIAKCQGAREHFESVERAFKAFTAFVTVVGRIAKVAADVIV